MPLHYKVRKAIEEKSEEEISNFLIYIHSLPTFEEKEAAVEWATFKIRQMIAPPTEEPPLTAQGD
ncbi:MAG: hypothetical protein ACTHMM_11970 [Agriterribacter sp.]